MSRNHHLICLPHHAPRISDGTKTTTIRSPRKHAVAVGDTITFAIWKGVPFRSRQERVRVVTVTSVRKIRVNRQTRGVFLDDEKQLANVVEKMAIADGFCGTWAMVDYLTSDKQPEFSGFIYGWDHAEQCQSCHRELTNGEQQYSCEVCNKDCCTACSDSCGRKDVVCNACLDSVCDD